MTPDQFDAWFRPRYEQARQRLVLDDNVPQPVVIQNDLIRYLFSDDDEEQEPWQPPQRS